MEAHLKVVFNVLMKKWILISFLHENSAYLGLNCFKIESEVKEKQNTKLSTTVNELIIRVINWFRPNNGLFQDEIMKKLVPEV